MKKSPKAAIKSQIKSLDVLEKKIKDNKHKLGFCAENVHCLNKVEKGRWSCNSCSEDVALEGYLKRHGLYNG